MPYRGRLLSGWPPATPLAEAGAELEPEDGAAPEGEAAAAAESAEPEADAPPAPAGGRAARPDERVERGGMAYLPDLQLYGALGGLESPEQLEKPEQGAP